MKIAILHDNFPPHSIGGADIVAFNLARALQGEGHEVIVVTTVRKDSEAGTATYEGLYVHAIATSYDLRFQAYVSLWNPSVVRQVKKILSEFKPDIVHAHNVHGYLSYSSLAVAKRLGSKVILTCHDVMSFNYTKLTDFIDPHDLSVPTAFNYHVNPWRQLKTNRFRYNPLRNVIIRWVLGTYVDHIVAVSEALRQALADNAISGAEVVHNGIDTGAWQEPNDRVAAFAQKYNLGRSVVLFGGRLTSIKGGGKLLDALSSITHTIPDLQLLVVGRRDAYAERMLVEAEAKGLKGRIIFTGWLSGRELHAAYHASALVAVPSLCFDSFPTMNLEAMACKKPVIATCFGGSSELVVDQDTGYIVNPYDVTLLASKLATLLGDGYKRTMFGERGYIRVKELFSINGQLAALKKYYRSS